MALQSDLIPVSMGPFCYACVEDGVVLGDEELRGGLARSFPSVWRRIEQRRHYMIGELGIELDESVLPLSDIPGWFPPYVMDQSIAVVH
jgi:hypothetical protein